MSMCRAPTLDEAWGLLHVGRALMRSTSKADLVEEDPENAERIEAALDYISDVNRWHRANWERLDSPTPLAN